VGLMPEKLEPAPINALLEKISDLEPEKIQVISRTLGQASVFNEIVRDQIAGMEIGERYEAITGGFNSIRDDAKRMVDQISDSKLDLMERATNVWMKIARGDIADRFDKVRAIYLDVTRDTKGQIDREHTILEAYRDYRGALKQCEVLALEVLKTATAKLDAAREGLKAASGKVADFSGPSLPTAPVSSLSATSTCGACRTKKSATRSPRTSRTTSPSPTTPPKS